MRDFLKITILYFTIVIMFTALFINFLNDDNKRKDIKPPTVDSSFTKVDSSITLFTIDGGTFDQDIRVIITTDTSFAREHINNFLHYQLSTEDLNVRGLFLSAPDNTPVLFICGYNGTPEDIAIVNHELFHATLYIMNWAGVPLSESSEEAYTFEMARLSKEFYSKYKSIKHT